MASDTNSPLLVKGRSRERRRSRNVSIKNSSFKLQKDEYTDEKIERLVNYSIDSIHVSKFLNDHIFNPSTDEDEDMENCISLEEKEYIHFLLEKRKDITERLSKITMENRELEEALFMKKMQLKESAKERNEAWTKAAEVLKSVSSKPNNSFAKYFTSTSPSNTEDEPDSHCSIFEEDSTRSTYQMKMKEMTKEKYRLIQEISNVLHKLISFSGIKWATEKKLLDIVLCTGQILNTEFNVDNPRHLEKFIVECMLKLNEVKWEL